MKYFVTLIMLFCATAQAAGKHDLEFSALAEHPVKQVQWIVADNVDSVCQGFAPAPGKTYAACTRFNREVCIVYTAPNLSLSVLGHEMRHCFEGQWHK